MAPEMALCFLSLLSLSVASQSHTLPGLHIHHELAVTPSRIQGCWTGLEPGQSADRSPVGWMEIA